MGRSETLQVAKANETFHNFGSRKICEADRRAMLRDFYLLGMPRTVKSYMVFGNKHNVVRATIIGILDGKQSPLNRRLWVEFLYNVKVVDGGFVANKKTQYSAETFDVIRKFAKVGWSATDISKYMGIPYKVCGRYMNGYKRVNDAKTVEEMALANKQSGIFEKLENARQPQKPQQQETKEESPVVDVADVEDTKEKTSREHIEDAFVVIRQHLDHVSGHMGNISLESFKRGQQMSRKTWEPEVEKARQEGYDAGRADLLYEVAECLGCSVDAVLAELEEHAQKQKD